MNAHAHGKLLHTCVGALLLFAVPFAYGQSNAIDRAVIAIAGALPAGWHIVERKAEQIPWGHHWCGKYEGVKGLELEIKGVQKTHSEFRGKDGAWRSVSVGTESLTVWIMPGDYSDSFWAWTCFHAPIQPTTVVKTGAVRVWARPSSTLDSKEEFDKLLSEATAVQSPDSPWNSPDTLTWKMWRKDLASAVSALER